ncbi:DNA glycosylase AlkZ-like family protein, partial [Streptomyces sp. YS-3]|uniref:DNA glycosylase AlkZ-like family protein n=1 Tax=Streptomyces sp. YS-3 TaxID=3381352 RepID=UPI003862800A
FLPEFDNLLLSHADRTRVIPAAYWGRSWKGNQAYPALLVDGFLAGVWRLAESAGEGRAVLTVQPFGSLGRALRDEVAEEGERLLAAMTPAGVTSYEVRFGDVMTS